MNISNKKKNKGFTRTLVLVLLQGVSWIRRKLLNVSHGFRIKGKYTQHNSVVAPKLVCGFTLIETLVAISILLLSISAPLTIASRGLASSFFARDQITAFYLAQDAVEYVRNARDNNFHTGANWLNGFPDTSGLPFTVDTTDGAMALCPGGTCAALEYNNATGFYSYDDPSGEVSVFTRSVSIQTINAHEVIISVTISWSVGTFGRTFSVKENILDWQ